MSKKSISTKVYLDFHKNKLSSSQYSKLKALVQEGIKTYWSRSINISSHKFKVDVTVLHRHKGSIDVGLEVETSANYARSHNSGIVDASFIYNKGSFGSSVGSADADFKLVSAHEFGHSVLEYFGGRDLSWGHKGSTGVLSQKIKRTTPGYPTAGPIDLMKYYDSKKNVSPIRYGSIISRSKATETDVKRLIWMSNVTFVS